MKQQCDIFCNVVDNFGDIGVCWRLARQLTLEYDVKVRLWLDDVSALSSIWPAVNADAEMQAVENIEVCRWTPQQNWAVVEAAEVVIQAFACTVPEGYIEQMLTFKKQAGHTPQWINLEYLSAESWIDDCHGMNSPQNNGLNKVFFFPGLSEKSGGLLRERDVLTRRDQRLIDDWSSLTGFQHDENALKIVLFGYAHMPLAQWLPLLADGEQSVQLAVTSGKAALAMHDACAALGQTTTGWGALSIRELPMLRQDDFDRLLWAADVNFVRGEDSFVRAIWAAKPLIWQIYPQDDGVHFEKLAAFVQHYSVERNEFAAALDAWARFQLAWNGDASINLAQAWTQLRAQLPNLSQHAELYAQQQAQTDDLAQQLVKQVRANLTTLA